MAFKVPFSRGVNFSKWFEARSVGEIDFSRYVEKDFSDVKSLGADVIRVPIALHNFTVSHNDFTLAPQIIKYLDAAVDWAEKNQIYIILDNHSFHPIDPTDENIGRILIPVWEQLSKHFKDRSGFVLYEILNEPHGIADERWAEIQGETIKEIRKADRKHAIIAGGVNFNSIEKMIVVPSYPDDKLIYTFHFYDPHIFTHQGATWNKPSLAPLRDLPFPADKMRVEVHESFKGTWVERCIENYVNDSKPEKLLSSLDRAASFSKERDVPVFCGEFGVFLIQSPPQSRVKWYEFVCGALGERKIPWTCWDYYGGFGIFKTQFKGDFPSDLNVDLIRAMGFSPVKMSI